MGSLKRRIIEELEPTMAEWERRWIPVDESLPDHTDPVLIYGERGRTIGFFDKGRWWLEDRDDELRIAHGVTHWMPLPAKPQTDK
jgi:hypothetical protein